MCHHFITCSVLILCRHVCERRSYTNMSPELVAAAARGRLQHIDSDKGLSFRTGMKSSSSNIFRVMNRNSTNVPNEISFLALSHSPSLSHITSAPHGYIHHHYKPCTERDRFYGCIIIILPSTASPTIKCFQQLI